MKKEKGTKWTCNQRKSTSTKDTDGLKSEEDKIQEWKAKAIAAQQHSNATDRY